MAIFQKQPIVQDVMPLFTMSAQKTIIIVGLGNPDQEYSGTRHNIGFACIDAFATDAEFQPWVQKKDLKCLLAQRTLGQSRVLLVKPTTYMNLSGEAVQAVSAFYKVGSKDIVVVHDELDIAFGQIRCRMGGGAAGHNGVKSVTQHIGGDYGRIRIGIGPKEPEQMDSADFVLAPFSTEQRGHMKALTREVTAILTETIYSGLLPHETRTF
jgi:peptidyl-tRNA hydrolase, PTH1 family